MFPSIPSTTPTSQQGVLLIPSVVSGAEDSYMKPAAGLYSLMKIEGAVLQQLTVQRCMCTAAVYGHWPEPTTGPTDRV